MVVPSRRSPSFYCYIRCLKLFIIVSSNALYIKIHKILVPLFYDVISKYDIIASTHMVAIGFLILLGECNLALQMASTEKLETRAVIKFRALSITEKTLCVYTKASHFSYFSDEQHQYIDYFSSKSSNDKCALSKIKKLIIKTNKSIMTSIFQ